MSSYTKVAGTKARDLAKHTLEEIKRVRERQDAEGIARVLRIHNKRSWLPWFKPLDFDAARLEAANRGWWGSIAWFDCEQRCLNVMALVNAGGNLANIRMVAEDWIAINTGICLQEVREGFKV